MCYEWWEERRFQEHERLAREQLERLKRSTETLVPSPKPQPEPKPERKPQTQPDPVPV